MNVYFSIKREETEGDRDDLLEEREETLPRISLHLKNATMLTTVCWKENINIRWTNLSRSQEMAPPLGSDERKPPNCSISDSLYLLFFKTEIT